MSRSILIITLGLFIGTFIACGPKETKTETTEKVEVTTTSVTNSDSTSIEAADNVAYQCPMKCEKGKTYEVMGICPVCKMDLAEAK